jgi:hypothetical protein
MTHKYGWRGDVREFMDFEFADMVDGTFCVFCVGETFVVALVVVVVLEYTGKTG